MSATPQVPFIRKPYPDGEPGIVMSLETICAKVRESAPTPVFRSFAGNILRQAFFPRTNKEKATAHFNHVKRSVGYTHDPPGTELIQAAPITLCVEGAPICIPIGDCDDICVALASLCAASGLEVEVVRQFFGSEHQQHVILEVRLEDGKWFPLDATTPRFGAGEKAKATRETRMNPWKEGGVGLQAEFVGIGALPVLGLGADGQYHQLPPDLVLGADAPEQIWYDVGEGVQMAHPIVKPLKNLAQGLEGLGDMIPDVTLPKLSTKAAVVAGAGIITGSAIVAAIIRKVRNKR
jgi:hypothetical protein